MTQENELPVEEAICRDCGRWFEPTSAIETVCSECDERQAVAIYYSELYGE